jgi:hypothetical protein
MITNRAFLFLIRMAFVLLASLVLMVIAIGALNGLTNIVRSQQGEDIYRTKDILQEWLLAKAIVTGTDPYLPTQELAERFLAVTVLVQNGSHPTPHPPTAGLLFLPLALFEYRTAVQIWLILELGFLIMGLYLILRNMKAARPWLLALALMLVCLAWGPVADDLALGQLTIVHLFLLAGAWKETLSLCRSSGWNRNAFKAHDMAHLSYFSSTRTLAWLYCVCGLPCDWYFDFCHGTRDSRASLVLLPRYSLCR